MPLYLSSVLGGVIIGLASWLLLAGLGRMANVSSIASAPLRRHRSSSTWRIVFLVGLIVGGGLFHLVLNVHLASLQAPALMIPAGLLVGFGAVLGSGCTTGHAVCGWGRRSTRSLVAVITFMSTGVATALVVASMRT